jgi:signal transduction histidine kinase
MVAADDPALLAQLAEREAKGLQVPVVGRILFCLFGFAQLVVLVQMASFPVSAVAIIGPAFLVGVGANVYFFVLLRRRRAVRFIGHAGAVLDVILLATESMAFEAIRMDLGVPAGFVFGTEFPLVMLTFVAINGLALRPRYPAIVTVGVLLVHLMLLARAVSDPQTVFSEDPRIVALGSATSMSQVVNIMLFTAAIGFVVSTMAAAARQTVKTALGEQLARTRLERAQVELVMQEKVSTLAHLVAGISHELNTPLGALESSTSTQRSALERLTGEVDAEPGSKAHRLLGIVQDTNRTQTEAAARIMKTGASIRAFAHLDEGERQRFDLGQEMARVLERIPPELAGNSGTEVRLEPGVTVEGDPRALGQVFFTILVNAYEAVKGSGHVQVKLTKLGNRARVDIADDGPGIPEEVMASLFEVILVERDDRVAAGFGLPAARSIVHTHGGSLDVETDPGRGTTFSVMLPTG